MQNSIIKLRSCPDCGGTCDGNSCRCGWTKRNNNQKSRRVYPTCARCNMPGDHGGLCKIHWEQQAENSYKKRMAEYEEALKPEPEPEPEQEEANDE